MEVTNPISVYQNPSDPDFYFITTSYPPTVYEMNIKDRYNFINHKIYTAVNGKTTHIGTGTIAANFNIVLHLMKDIETGENFIRFYDRFANRFEVSKYDYYLDKNWK